MPANTSFVMEIKSWAYWGRTRSLWDAMTIRWPMSFIFQGQGERHWPLDSRKKGREPRLGTEKTPVVIRKQGNEQLRGLGFQEDPGLDPGGQEALVDGPSQLHGGMGEQEGKSGKTTQIRALLRAVFQHAPGIGIILFQQMVGADHVNMVVEEGRGI